MQSHDQRQTQLSPGKQTPQPPPENTQDTGDTQWHLLVKWSTESVTDRLHELPSAWGHGAWKRSCLHFQQPPQWDSPASSHSLWAGCCWVCCKSMRGGTWEKSVNLVVSWRFFLRHSHIGSSRAHEVMCYTLKDSEKRKTHTTRSNQKSASLVFAGLKRWIQKEKWGTFLLGTAEYVICRGLYVCSLFLSQ